jgi:alpha-maltose-1-phosphate synthase
VNSSGHQTIETAVENLGPVLILTTEYPPHLYGGLGTHVDALARGLAERGIQLTVVAPSPDQEGRSEASEIVVAWVKTRWPVELWYVPRVIRELFSGLLERSSQLLAELPPASRPKVVHCHDWMLLPAAMELRARFGLRVVATTHFLRSEIPRFEGTTAFANDEEQACLRQCDRLIAVSQSQRDILADRYGIRERVDVVYNGCEPSALLSASELAPFRLQFAGPLQPLVVFAGRLTRQKGVHHLLEAMLRVWNEFPNALLTFAGRHVRSEEQGLMQWVQRHGAQDRVRFLGWVPRDRLMALFQVSDVVAVPSLYEPFGYSAVEAMFAGVAVVASATGGLTEVIEDGRSGVLVPTQDGEDGLCRVDEELLAKAIVGLLRDPELRGRLAQEGQRVARERFGSDAMISGTLTSYWKAVHGGQESSQGSSLS